MKILGYSERGIVSSLFHEIAFSPGAEELLSALLKLVSFPFVGFVLSEIRMAQILVEQSFSDFGDLDALLMFETNRKRHSIFFEAKVKPIQSKQWGIQHEWQEFLSGMEGRLSSSNLFTQLYHKVRLVKGLQEVGIEGLQSGLEFPACSTKTLRKIGSNEVVLRATRLLKQHLQGVYFVAIIPDDPLSVRDFFSNTLRESSPKGFAEWDISHWGHLSWAQVAQFCSENGLHNTLAVFDHNRGQIY